MEELLTINKDNLSFLVIDCRYEYEYKGFLTLFCLVIIVRLFRWTYQGCHKYCGPIDSGTIVHY